MKRIRLTESGLHKIVKESVKRVLKEGGPRVNFSTDNEGLEKKWVVYERLVKKIIDAKEDLKRITGRQSPEARFYTEKDENLWNFVHALDDVLAEYGLESGFDSTADVTW